MLRPNFHWLTGPILDKELRVLSRKGKYYGIRSVYLLLLTLFVLTLWLALAWEDLSIFNYADFMAQVGCVATVSIIWFQFITLPMIAAAIMSTAISNEIQRRSLGILLTTPITSLQIVTGKLGAGLLYPLTLLLLSLPFLAIIRATGGFPLPYLLAGLALTLSMTLLLAMISLHYSLFNRKANIVLTSTVVTVGVVYGLIPLFVYLFAYAFGKDRGWNTSVNHLIFLSNPYWMLVDLSEPFFYGQQYKVNYDLQWIWSCLTALAGTFLIYLSCIFWVSRTVRPKWTKQLTRVSPPQRQSPYKAQGLNKRLLTNTWLVFWKECQRPLLCRRPWLGTILIAATSLTILTLYIIYWYIGWLDAEEFQTLYVMITMAFAAFFTIVIPATTITYEKESGCWPALLCTALRDSHILLGKYFGAVRRCLPAWSILSFHITLFTLAQIIHPLTIVQIGLIALGIIIMHTGAGIYFSIRFRRTITAVLFNLSLPLLIWIVIPLVSTFILQCLRLKQLSKDLITFFVDANPLVQAGVIMDGNLLGGHNGILNYCWSTSSCRAIMSLFCISGTTAFNMILGALFLLRANAIIRRRVF